MHFYPRDEPWGSYSPNPSLYVLHLFPFRSFVWAPETTCCRTSGALRLFLTLWCYLCLSLIYVVSVTTYATHFRLDPNISIVSKMFLHCRNPVSIRITFDCSRIIYFASQEVCLHLSVVCYSWFFSEWHWMSRNMNTMLSNGWRFILSHFPIFSYHVLDTLPSFQSTCRKLFCLIDGL